LAHAVSALLVTSIGFVSSPLFTLSQWLNFFLVWKGLADLWCSVHSQTIMAWTLCSMRSPPRSWISTGFSTSSTWLALACSCIMVSPSSQPFLAVEFYGGITNLSEFIRMCGPPCTRQGSTLRLRKTLLYLLTKIFQVRDRTPRMVLAKWACQCGSYLRILEATRYWTFWICTGLRRWFRRLGNDFNLRNWS
jgi:hypothetical protein